MNVQVYDSIRQVGQDIWDRLATGAFPFARYHFLAALETTDCLDRRTGWFPSYLVVRDGDVVRGALICYLRANSYGEYIFDFAWAQGAQSAGLNYYPKLTAAIPFTPATGPKLLIDPGLDADAGRAVRGRLLRALIDLTARADASSAHGLFIPPAEIEDWRRAGFQIRDSYQFHWKNDGYATFADFLTRLRGKRRREILRERAQVRAGGVTIRRLTGAALTPELAATFHRFYLSTIDKRSSFDYLTAEFFAHVFAHLGEQILLVLAEDAAGRPVAGALNYFDARTLYGRQWGCLAEYRALHFELCYYQGLEFAIERGFDTFEAGAQGEHKLQRGFLPTLTASAHFIRDPDLGRAVAHFIAAERAQIADDVAELRAHSPFADRGAPPAILGYAGAEGDFE